MFARALAVVLIALALPASLDAQPLATRRRTIQPPETGLEIHTLAGYLPTLSNWSDLAPFGTMVGDAGIVGLGESWHTSGGFYLLKHRLFRYLVEEKGFRAFAIESDWEGVERTDAYVQSCSGTPQDAINQSNVVWQSTEYADMVRWMCEWNSMHSDPADQLTVFGFDIQQPEIDGPKLGLFLSQSGIPATDPRQSGLRSCESAFGLTHPFGEIPDDVHAKCLDALDGIESYLETNRAAIIAGSSKDAYDVLMLRVIGLRAFQEQTFYIRDEFAKGFSYRDAGMAYAFHHGRAAKAPDAKTVVWAADIHVAQGMPTGEVPLGEHLADSYGDDYVSFATTAYESEQDWGSSCALAARKAGSFEERLMTYGKQTLLARPRGRQYDVVPMGFFTFRPLADFDGVFFLAHSPAMHPLAWKGCR